MLAEIEKFSSESGISMDNLLAVNSVIGALPEGEINEFIEELGDLIEEGFAEQVDSFLSELSEIDGGLNAIAQYESFEDCVAGGGGDQPDYLWALLERCRTYVERACVISCCVAADSDDNGAWWATAHSAASLMAL